MTRKTPRTVPPTTAEELAAELEACFAAQDQPFRAHLMPQGWQESPELRERLRQLEVPEAVLGALMRRGGDA